MAWHFKVHNNPTLEEKNTELRVNSYREQRMNPIITATFKEFVEGIHVH